MVYKTRHRFSQALRTLPFAIGIVLAFISCSKDPIREKPIDPPDPTDSINYKHGCYVVNEGNFNWGNASVTFIDAATSAVDPDAFSGANQRSLGDVAQSMKIHNGRGYIIVNNSNKIEVVSLDDFSSVKTITGFNSPRYMEIIDSTKAYVTNLKGGISVVDLNTLEITGTIETPDWTERMVVYKQDVFITSVGKFSSTSAERKAMVFVISAKEDKITDSILTGKEPLGIVIDKKDQIWVLCTGGWDGEEPPALLRVNPNLRTVEKSYVFSGAEGVPSQLCINPGRDTLYFLRNGIYRMPVTSASLPSQSFITGNGKLFYGLDVNPQTGEIWASDAVDYVQNGWVYKYNASTGALLETFKAGRIPGSFAFSLEE